MLTDEALQRFTSDSMSFANLIMLLTEERDSLDDNSDSLNAIRIDRNSIVTTINSGNVLVDMITNLDNGSDTIFTDSATLYSLPLEVARNEINYEIIIADSIYEVGITYSTDESLTILRDLNIIAFDLDTLFHTFDSLDITFTNADRLSNETTFTCYF